MSDEGLGIQRAVPVGPKNDPSEREADAVAEQVMRAPRRGAATEATPAPRVQRAGGGAHQPAAVNGTPPRIHRPSEQSKREMDAAPASVDRILGSPGRPLEPALRQDMEQRFGYDFSGVRVHSGAAAEQSAKDVNAQAYTVGHDVVFGAGVSTQGTYEGRRLVAHELTHVVQQSGADSIRVGLNNESLGLSPIALQHGAPGRLARKTLTDLPEATRKTLRISRAAPAQADVDTWIKNYFNPTSGISVTAGITTEFGAEITDANQQKGLRSVAIDLVGLSRVVVTPATATEPEQRSNTDPENWPLPDNSILDLALDLRAHGGEHAIFRFVHFSEGGTDKVLIEKKQVLAAAPAAGAAARAATADAAEAATRGTPGTTSQPTAAQPQPAAAAFTGTVTVGNVKVIIGSSFGNDRGKVIADTVQLLPEPIRAKIDGVTFDYAGSGKGPGGRAGHYEAADDKVSLWGDIFNDSPRRVGTATNTAYQIVHELGHVVDLRPEFKAQRERDKAEAAKKILEGQLKNPTINVDSNDPLAGLEGENDPKVVAEKARLRGEINKLDKDIEAHNRAMAGAKSIAGGELGTDTEKLLTDFGKAIEEDGVKAVKEAKKRNRAVEAANEQAAKANAANPSGPQTPMQSEEKTLTTGLTNYAATNLMEAFAENFSVYVLDEALLKALRPKTHAYFVRKFPKTAGVKP